MTTPTGRTIVEHLLESDLFAGIDAASLEDLRPPFEWISVEGGQRILQQGEIGKYFFMLVHGRLKVTVVGDDGQERQVGNVRAGEGVGEMSLIGHRRITANVTAQRDCNLIRCASETFDNLMRTSPAAALNITRNIIERLDATYRGAKASKDLSTIVLAASSPLIDMEAVTRMLEAALAMFGSVGIIRESARGLDNFNAYLHEQEDRFDHVLLVCPAGSDDWLEVCLRQSDRVLMVVDADDSPTAATINSALAQAGADLLMLHKKEFRRGTFSKPWRARFQFQDLYHVREAESADYQRLARIQTGRANNLILSGGAAHSFAQIGVIRALQEAAIPIDRVCGTSMGALIAAQYSLGMTTTQMLEQNRRIWVDGKPISDFTFPAIAIVRGKRLQDLIRDALGEQEIEDMPIPFSCTSTNLTHARQEFHRSGSLWRAVRASGTIPGIGPPLFMDGSLLVDGGVLSNSPVEIFTRHYSGNVMCVDVGLRTMLPVDVAWNDRVDSGWSLLWRRLNPFRPSRDVPTIIDILYRVATLGSASSDQKASRPDLCFSLDLNEYPASRFSAIDAIAEKGYLHAKRQLDQADLAEISRPAVISEKKAASGASEGAA